MQMNIETAVAEIKQYANRELQLLNQRAEKQIELQIAERSGGDDLLDGNPVDLDRVVRLHAELRQIDLAITSCRARRLAAVQQKLAAEIQDLRQRAADSRQQADAITAKTQEHFAAIRALENAGYSPTSQPESARLMSMSNLLARSADELQQRGIATTGNIQIVDGGLTPETIVRTVLEHASAGPSAEQIFAWITSHDGYKQMASHRVNAYVVWSNGQIDGAASRIQILESLEPPAAAPPETEAPVDTSRLRTPNQFFGHAAPPVPQEKRG